MNRSLLLVKTTAAALAFYALATGVIFAQGLPNPIGRLSLSADMDNPSPGQNVTIRAASYSFDINSAGLTWTAGGKTIAKGLGVTTAVVQAPALGKRLTVNVSAVSASGDAVSNSIVISSGSVDMIIETDGYVPPFFGGKAPIAYENTVKIIAIPHLANSSGVEYDPRALVYSWKNGSTVLQDQSGYSKQSVVIPGTLVPRPYTASVTVTSRDGSAQTQGFISVTAAAPSITFYRNDPLYGPLFNDALGNTVYIGSQQEVGVLAAPYGFNMSSSGADSLSFFWSINSTAHDELAGHQSVTLRAPSGAAGSSNVQLRATGVQAILQQATAGFSAVFSSTASSSQPSAAF